MSFWIKNKKGVTVLEGLIALLLLALISVGTFGVLLSTSRKTAKPDIQEEMLFAVEKANDLLQIYSFYMLEDAGSFTRAATHGAVVEAVRNALCIANTSVDPLSTEGSHDLGCMLPPICDLNNSSFSYTVSSGSIPATSYYWNSYGNVGHEAAADFGNGNLPTRNISFSITCNGYSL